MSLDYKAEINEECQIRINELLGELPEFYNYYVEAFTRTRSRRTLKQYLEKNLIFLKYLCDKHPHFCDLSPVEIKPEDLDYVSLQDANRFLNFMYYHQADNPKAANTNRTVDSYSSAINSIWNYLLENGIISSNPFNNVQRSKKKNSDPIFLKGEENISFYENILSGKGLTNKQLEYRDRQHSVYRDYVICRLLGTTGLRVSELASLDIDDIDFKHELLTVVRKGDKDNEIKKVYLSKQMLDELKVYIYDERPLFYPTDDVRALFVISQGKQQGQRLGVKSIERMVKKYAKASGLEDASKFTPHKLRHTYAVNSLKNTGGNLRMVQELMNHQEITSTTIYTHIVEEEKKKNANSGEYRP